MAQRRARRARQMELRDLARGSKAAGRWRPDDAVEVVRLESRPFQYLYSEGTRGRPSLRGRLAARRRARAWRSRWMGTSPRADGRLLVMDPVTYEQRSVPRALLGERAAWLVEGATLQLSLHGDDVLAGAPPTSTLCLGARPAVRPALTPRAPRRPAAAHGHARGAAAPRPCSPLPHAPLCLLQQAQSSAPVP